jgi:hypothetical protein
LLLNICKGDPIWAKFLIWNLKNYRVPWTSWLDGSVYGGSLSCTALTLSVSCKIPSGVSLYPSYLTLPLPNSQFLRFIFNIANCWDWPEVCCHRGMPLPYCWANLTRLVVLGGIFNTDTVFKSALNNFDCRLSLWNINFFVSVCEGYISA